MPIVRLQRFTELRIGMRHRLLPVFDLAAIALAACGAFMLRLDPSALGTSAQRTAWLGCLGVALVVKPFILVTFGLYRRYWPYAYARDLLIALVAIATATAATAIVAMGLVKTGVMPSFPYSILAIDGLITLMLLGGVRACAPMLADVAHQPRTTPALVVQMPRRSKRVLIVGAGEVGCQVAREAYRNPQLGLTPIGFLDDEPSKWQKHIQDVPVFGPISSLEATLDTHRIDEVIVAIASVPGGVVRTVVDACRRANVASRMVPGMVELLDGGFRVNRLREIDIADLLRRRPIDARVEAGSYLQGQVVLVTGAGGSIGSELCRQVARANPAAVVLLGHGENSVFDVANALRESFPAIPVREVIADVRNERRLQSLLREHRPDVVFHAAAHKHVRLMESHPEEAITNNVLGTRTLVNASLEADVRRFVFISTDKAVAPTSIMGASKRVAELIVRDVALTHQREYVAVRFGNVLGSRGSVIPEFKRQIERGGPITVTHAEAKRFFMTIPEAVYLVLKAGGLSQGGELFVLNMGEPVRIVDLAQDLIRLSGLAPDDIPLSFIGLRQGEKLDEALWEPDSVVEPAAGDGDVFRVLEPATVLHSAHLHRTIAGLSDAAARGDARAIHQLLSDVIPTFESQLPALGAAERQIA
jgi:FlaA1/EpsC-like NDP-sugar epimerase